MTQTELRQHVRDLKDRGSYKRGWGLLWYGDRVLVNLRVAQHAIPTVTTCLELSYLHIEWYDRGKGYGTKALRRICRFADKLKVPIVVWPHPFDLEEDKLTFSQCDQRLKRFYRSFGFHKVRGEDIYVREVT